jgi:hypothetical protein
MSVYNLVYMSESRMGSTTAETMQAVDDILAKARHHNEAVDVTGALLFTEGRFVQVLEGERDKVHKIFDRIGTDARHADIEILSAQYSDRRRFKEWSMAFVGDNQKLRDKFADAPLAALGKRPAGDSLLDFMLELAQCSEEATD